MDDEKLSKHQTDSPTPRLAEASAKRAEKETLEHSKTVRKSNILKSKFLIPLVIFLIIIAFLIGGVILLGKNSSSRQANQTPSPTPAGVACTMEVKLCPDGITSVGRSGPNCEFEKCPAITATTPTEIPSKVSQAFLEVPEFGIKFALSEDIKDAYVVTPKSGEKDYVYLKVHSLDNEPQCNSDESSTAALSKAGKDDVNEMSGQKYSDSYDGAAIGNYFYYIDLAQYECAESSAGKAKLEEVRKAFSNASSKITSL